MARGLKFLTYPLILIDLAKSIAVFWLWVDLLFKWCTGPHITPHPLQMLLGMTKQHLVFVSGGVFLINTGHAGQLPLREREREGCGKREGGVKRDRGCKEREGEREKGCVKREMGAEREGEERYEERGGAKREL